MGADERPLWHLNPKGGSSVQKPVLLTENGPLGTPIRKGDFN